MITSGRKQTLANYNECLNVCDAHGQSGGGGDDGDDDDDDDNGEYDDDDDNEDDGSGGGGRGSHPSCQIDRFL